MRQLLDNLAMLLPAAEFHISASGRSDAPPQHLLRGDVALITRAIRFLPNRGARFRSRDIYIMVAIALKAALPDNPALARELFIEWAIRWEDGEGDADVAGSDFDRCQAPFMIGASWLFNLVEAATRDLPLEERCGRWLPYLEQPPVYIFPPEPGTALAREAEGLPPEPVAQPDEGIFFFGDPRARQPKTWLIDKLFTTSGVGLLSGMWSSGKTFCAMSLAMAVATGGTFAHRPIRRTGSVIIIAAEGAGEVNDRLEAASYAAGVKGGLPPPIAWLDTASITHGYEPLRAKCRRISGAYRETHDVELALIIVDTFAAATSLSDVNNAGEAQAIMNRLRELGREFGCAVLAVDHFGKQVDAGTIGSSQKESAADTVIAVLADRGVGRPITNRRIHVRKNRAGKDGDTVGFNLREVPIVAPDGTSTESTCHVQWLTEDETAKAKAQPRLNEGAALLVDVVADLLAEHGKDVALASGEIVRGLMEAQAKEAFTNRFVPRSDGDARGVASAKRSAWKRARDGALAAGVLRQIEAGGADYIAPVPMAGDDSE